tara:strand:- start:304 stop:453 length:150 start_codon:yes stop_codon:yes gene_type:complete
MYKSRRKKKLNKNIEKPHPEKKRPTDPIKPPNENMNGGRFTTLPVIIRS